MNDITVLEVLADPAFRDAAVPNQLAEVMKRSKGAANPHNVQQQLAAHLRVRMQVAEEDNVRLRVDLRELRETYASLAAHHAAVSDEVERLRRALETLDEYVCTSASYDAMHQLVTNALAATRATSVPRKESTDPPCAGRPADAESRLWEAMHTRGSSR